MLRRLLRPFLMCAIFLACVTSGLLLARFSQPPTQDPLPTKAALHSPLGKAIRLKVTLLVEGEEAPANNFAEAAGQAVKDAISEGGARHPQLHMRVVAMTEQSGEQAEEASEKLAGR